MPGTLRRLLVAATAASAVAFFVAGCSSSSDGTPMAAADSETAVTSSSAPTTTRIVGQEGDDDGGRVSIDVAIGDCVKLGGTMTNAEIDKADCGSADSNYKVVAKVPSNSQCASDVDSYYYETFGGNERGAVCLDVDWVIGGCVDLGFGSTEPAHVDCGASDTSNGVKVLDILQNTSSIDDCGGESDSGFSYPERNFAVCAQTL
ncbi:hypothetical protein ABH922_003950 [Rhodococcus sp. 27YEA15]|uniref:LppU family putative lipoprotein n=1 Tax=Rhodococcus sp. 27YEA15 TaxID=3156259 RepID=UPI003C7B9185